jgi:WD40 repeat protein
LDGTYGGVDALWHHVRHWDVASGKQEQLWAIPNDTYTLSLVPDGKTVLAVMYGHNIIIRDAESGRERLLRGQEKEFVRTMVLSPDAKFLASGTNSYVRLWDVETGKEKSLLKGHTGSVTALAWSPDGRMVASGDQGNNRHEVTTKQTVRVWDTATGNELARFGGFKADVTALTFSPDGAHLLAGLADSTILVWEVPRFRP